MRQTRIPTRHLKRRGATRAALTILAALLVFGQESHYYLTGYDSTGYVFFQAAVLTADEVTEKMVLDQVGRAGATQPIPVRRVELVACTDGQGQEVASHPLRDAHSGVIEAIPNESLVVVGSAYGRVSLVDVDSGDHTDCALHHNY